MTGAALPPIVGVTGGVAGPAATYQAVRALADRYDEAADRLRDWATDDLRVMAEPDLLESAVLSPMTFAEAETRVLAAAGGVHGAGEVSVAYQADALLVRATVGAFQECDRLVADSFAALDHAVGFGVGFTVAMSAPMLLALGLVAAPPLALAWQHLPTDVRRRLDAEADAVGVTGEEWLDEHPDATQHAVDGSGGLLDGLLAGAPYLPALLGIAPFHATAGDAAADLASSTHRRGRPTYAAVQTSRCPWARARRTTSPGSCAISPRPATCPPPTGPATRARSRCRPCRPTTPGCATSSTSPAPTT